MSVQGGFDKIRASSERPSTVNNSKFSNSQFNNGGNESRGLNNSFNQFNKADHMQNQKQNLRGSLNINKYSVNSNINANLNAN